MLIVLIAVLPVARYIHLEFHMHNVNLLALALVSLALVVERSWWSPLCYAFSLAIKPYGSVLLWPWMVWQGRRKWSLASLAWIGLLFVGLPALAFGFEAVWRLHHEWLASTFHGAQSAHDGLMSVRGGLAVLAGTSRINPIVVAIDRIMTVLYLVSLAAFFWPTLRRGAARGPLIASEAAALLLAPLPLGGLQQPARACVLVTATLVVAAAIFDEHRSFRVRATLAGSLVLIAVLAIAVPIGPLNCLVTMPICWLALGGLALTRRTSTLAVAQVQNP
jgi:hypothetical protein